MGASVSRHHAHLWGARDAKYAFCRSANLSDAHWTPIEANAPFYLFIARDAELTKEYQSGAKVTEIFGSGNPRADAGVAYGLGICTHNDLLHVGFTKNEVAERIRLLANESVSDAEVLARLPIAESPYWQTKRERKKVRESDWQSNIWRLYYRPFDWRFIYYEPSLMEIGRGGASRQVMPHANKDNLSLMVSRGYEVDSFEHVLISDAVAVHHAATRKEGNYLFPLYLYPSKTQTTFDMDAQLLGVGRDGRRANLSPAFVAQMGRKLGLRWIADGRGDGAASFGPDDVLSFIYALFHAPSYRARYAEFLKTDFPRVPLPADAALFWGLVAQGRALLEWHTMDEEKPVAHALGSQPVPQGEVAPGFPKYQDGRVLINARGGFDNVSEAAWNFHIGGYQVAHKWLKDRKGRVLTPDDAAHYRRIIAALDETIERMAAIDELIESAGGFPMAGSDETREVNVTAYLRGPAP